jgi:radical SAM superfamily enzyme YgiQ (UPF0313 family)
MEFPWGRDKDPRVPLGHASLLASLIDKEIKVHSLVHSVSEGKLNIGSICLDIMQIQKLNNPLIVDLAIGAYVWAEEVIIKLIKLLRKSGFNGRIILGGPQISYTERDLEKKYPEVDIFIRGYGELNLPSVITSNSKVKSPGVHYCGEIDDYNQSIVDLDKLPSPWLNNIINTKQQEFIRWESQRGCPFKCTFCQHKEPGARLISKQFASSRILKEIDLFCKENIKDIAVLDPIFNATPFSNKILERFYENSFKGRLSLQCRLELINDDFINIASKLNVCLEFGLQTIHLDEGRAVKRQNNMKIVEKNIEIINLKELDYEITLIYGLPEQTLSSFIETVNWCLERSVPRIKAFPLMLLRGTELSHKKKQWGLKESNDSMKVVTSSDTFDYRDWEQMAKISDALKKTEDNHPFNVYSLLKWNGDSEIKFDRFIPSLQ